MPLQQILWAISILTSIIGAVRWLVSFYFKKAGELENLKVANRAAASDAIEKNIQDLRAAVTVFRQELNSINVKLAEYAGQLRENSRNMEAIQRQFERVVDRLEDRYKALDGAEVVKVGKDTFIFKTRRT